MYILPHQRQCLSLKMKFCVYQESYMYTSYTLVAKLKTCFNILLLSVITSVNLYLDIKYTCSYIQEKTYFIIILIVIIICKECYLVHISCSTPIHMPTEHPGCRTFVK